MLLFLKNKDMYFFLALTAPAVLLMLLCKWSHFVSGSSMSEVFFFFLSLPVVEQCVYVCVCECVCVCVCS